jgi:glucose uptake protein
MYLPVTFAVALIMTILSAVFWGSWANSYKWTHGYRFELFYWDYIIGVVVLALVFAFTFGSHGHAGVAFLGNVRVAYVSNIVYALIGGFIFNIANLLLVAGIELAGLAVAFPISIGIALIEGVVLSYAIQPKGNAGYLAVGVILALVAIIFDALAYSSMSRAGRQVSRKGIVVNVISGLLMGAFAPFITKALNAGITTGHALTPYGATVFFAIGALACCFVVNIYLMRRPLIGKPVNFSGFWSARASDHALGFVGGVVWGLGTSFNFIAASFVGMAISYAIGQCSPMIAALWGVFVFKEFEGSGKRARGFVALMFAFYVAAIVVIAKAYKG